MTTCADDDDDVIVAVFDRDHRGYLPISQFAKLTAEMDAVQAHLQLAQRSLKVARAEWFIAGAAIGMSLVMIASLAGI